jgi:hypothetical protein
MNERADRLAAQGAQGMRSRGGRKGKIKINSLFLLLFGLGYVSFL